MEAHREALNAEAAPEAIGPYSHAVRAGDLLFCSGQIPLDPATNEMVGKTVGDEATQCLRNLAAVCDAAGTGLDRAVRLTVYTTVAEKFDEINEAYARFFEADPPARVVVGAARLPKGALVEIDAIVACG